MKIFINQKESSNINNLMNEPAVVEAIHCWGKTGVYKKSSIELQIFHTPFGSISLLYGPRQIGKTASLKLFLSQLHDSDTIIYTDCSTILHRQDLYQHLLDLIDGQTTIVLDEVQATEQWHLALRALYSEGKLSQCRIWCTGSEARYLLESGERLPGRRGDGKVVFARPWSFREYLEFFYPKEATRYRTINIKHVTQQWLDDQDVAWRSYWNEYCLAGGIPHAVAQLRRTGSIPDTTWRVYVDWIMGSWSTVRTAERSLTAVARRLCETLNSRVSYEAIKKGTDIQSANTVKTLLDIQEDHFSIRVVPRFDLQKGKFLPAKLKKIYPIDPYIARVWSAIGWNVRRLYHEGLPALPLDECAFASQMQRAEHPVEISYLYSETSQSEVDFYFDGCAFELKSNGNPTHKQWAMLKQCPHAFVVKKDTIPLVAYVIGEGRAP